LAKALRKFASLVGKLRFMIFVPWWLRAAY